MLCGSSAGACSVFRISLTSPTGVENVSNNANNPSFSEIDTNADNKLTLEEILAFGSNWDENAFYDADTNDDGALSEDELINHGEEIIVVGNPNSLFLGFYDFRFGIGHRYFDVGDWIYDDDGSWVESSPPSCTVSNPATIMNINGVTYSGLDGAKYYVPEGIDNNYINAVANHIINIKNNEGLGALYTELYDMYTVPTHQYFIDFKEFGTASLPGTQSGGNQIYFSEAAGEWVETSYFEPFGNVVYGYMLTVAGYSPEEIWAIAAVMQEGGGGLIPSDDLQDQPHVNLGISIAQQYLAYQSYSPININSDFCP